MSTAMEYARSATTRPLRSTDAYLLPHLVDVSAGTHGVIRAVLVSPHDLVQRGQDIAVLEPLSEGPLERRRLVVKAPAAGLVTRNWAMTGDVVAASWPILSMASTEDIMVVAVFPLEDAVRIRRGGSATVFSTAAGEALAARIVCVAGLVDAGAPEGLPGGASARVVLALQDSPAKATWPGTPVTVEIP